MRPGERVRVRTEDKSEKVWARVVARESISAQESSSELKPGTTTIRLVLEVEQ